MKILVLNCGSSSIKYALYNMDDKSVMTSGGAERVGLDGAFVKVKLANGEKKQIMHDIPEHTEGVKFIFSLLTDPEIGVIKSLSEIDAVGHRMVHGGEKFNKSVILTDEVLKEFEKCSDLAPLHNPANGSASQPSQLEGRECREGADARSATGRCVRYSLPSDHASKGLYVCHSFRTL